MPVIVKIGSDEIEKQVIPCGVSQAAPLFPPANGSVIMPFQTDLNGAQFVHPSGGQVPADALPTPALSADSTSYTMVWNGASWDRAESLSSNADAQAANMIGLIGSIARNTVFNGATWDRMLSIRDNADNQAVNAIGLLATISRLQIWNPSAAQWNRLVSSTDQLDSTGNDTTPRLSTVNRPSVFNGVNWDRKRTPKIFKTVTVTAAGSTAVWTPAAGKKFRLMGYSIEVTGNAIQAVGGNFEAVFLDAATAIGAGSSWYIPAAALNVFGSDGGKPFELGNGYLSTLANNALNINLSAALTGGEIRVNVWGTEE